MSSFRDDPIDFDADEYGVDDDLGLPPPSSHRRSASGGGRQRRSLSAGRIGRSMKNIGQGARNVTSDVRGKISSRRNRGRERSDGRGRERRSSRSRSRSGSRPRRRSFDSSAHSANTDGDSRYFEDDSPRGNKKSRLLANYDKYQHTLRNFSVRKMVDRRRNAWDEESGDSRDPAINGRSGGDRRSGLASAHPWVLPTTHRLAPRIDVWFGFAIASCAAVASMGQIHRSATNGEGGNVGFGARDVYALTTCIVSFIVSFCVAVGMR